MATPIFNPPGGVYRESQVVTITTETPGARIHYKIARIEDTSEPTEADPLYTEPIVVDKSCTIRAKAFRDGAPPSSSASADYSLNVLYVSKSGSDQNSGLSWTNAFATIGKALSIAQPGSEVWVAKGTYYECVTLKPGVGLYGGFIGNETRRGDRPHFPRPNPDNNATTLTFVDDSVVHCLSGAGPDTILDGFVIENGFSEKSDPSQGFGGGVYISRSSPTVSHNTIRNCGAYWGGGGIAAMWESSAPVIFANVIENNTAFQGGGIIAFEGASPKIISNFIRGNTADAIPRPPYYSQGGGGLFISGNSKALIASNLITYNSTNYFRGGGICCENGSGIPVIVNNTVSYNSAPDCAGGIYGGAIKNCIVFNNNASSGKDKDVYSDWPGPNIVGSNPGLNANYEPFCDSTCVDKGDDSVISTVFADFCGMPRLMGSHVDIGAYEAKKVSDVVLNPSGGFYSAPLSVTMTCSTEGSTIHYTINGQEPTENDPVYLGPIRVDQDTVVRARAFLPGACPSEVTEGNYEIPGIVQAPTMSPPGGTYVGYKDVMITCETPGAVIHYTMDGRDPTESDPIITSGSSLRISASTIVKAKAWRNNWIPSETTVASFEILYQVAPPRSTPVGGRYSKPQLVTLSCSTPGATIKYTLDDTDPASSPTAMKYVPGHPILIPNGVTTLTAKAFRDEWLDSPSLRQVYIVGINRELAIAYLQSAQMPDGSLSGGYPVMLALKLLGSDVSRPADLLNHLWQSQKFDGSFGFSMRKTVDSITTLALMNEVPPNAQAAMWYLKNHHLSDGTFSELNKNEWDIWEAIKAVLALADSLESINIDSTRSFVTSRQQPNGIFKGVLEDYGCLRHQYAGLLLCRLLGINVPYEQSAIELLRNCQNRDNGRLPGSYQDWAAVVAALRMFGLTVLDIDKARDNVVKSQLADGSWQNNILETAWAVITLSLLDQNSDAEKWLVECKYFPTGYDIAVPHSDGCALINPDTGDIRRLPLNFCPWLIDWWPSGKDVLAVKSQDGYGYNCTLYRVNLAGLDEALLHRAEVKEARLSPDGRRILYTDSRGICSCTVNGADDKVIIPSGRSPRWSPDGSRIAFIAQDGLIYTSDPDGRNCIQTLRPASGNSVVCLSLIWSPDGRWIYFTATTNYTVSQIYRVRSLSTPPDVPEALTASANCKHGISVSPDGKQIAYAAGPSMRKIDGIWVMNVDGSNVRLIYEFSAPISSQSSLANPCWCPLGVVVNHAPAVSDDAVFAVGTELVEIPVLLNDFDPDYDPLSVFDYTSPLYGSLSLVDKSKFVYKPEAHYAVGDEFVYRVTDGAGHLKTGKVGVSTLNIQDSEITADIARAKFAGINTIVELSNVLVTAVFGYTFYVQDQNRIAGIRVDWLGQMTPKIGDKLFVRGFTRIDNETGELYVDAIDVSLIGNGMVEPLFVTHRMLAGSGFGIQGGVWNWHLIKGEDGKYYPYWTQCKGLSTIGLLVKVCGKVMCIDAANKKIRIDDGSKIMDFNRTGTGLLVACDTNNIKVGSCVVVEGISSCYRDPCTGDILPLVKAVQVSTN